MSSSVPSKVFIKVDSAAEQQELVKSSRKSSRTLAVLQKTGTVDKENLVRRQPAYLAKEQLIRKGIESEIAQTPESKRKIPTNSTASAASQTSPSLDPSTSKQVTVEDLTSDNVGEKYWEILAEKRRAALEESLTENQELHERIASLEDELNQSKSMLTETRNLVEVLTEMLEEKQGNDVTLTAEEKEAIETDQSAANSASK